MLETQHSDYKGESVCQDAAVKRVLASVLRVAPPLLALSATSVLSGCASVSPYSCSDKGGDATDHLRDDIAVLRTVTAAQVVSDCDSGGDNVVYFDTTTPDAAREEFQGLKNCRLADLPRGESKDTGFGFRCDFASGPAKIFLVRDPAMGGSEAVTQRPG